LVSARLGPDENELDEAARLAAHVVQVGFKDTGKVMGHGIFSHSSDQSVDNNNKSGDDSFIVPSSGSKTPSQGSKQKASSDATIDNEPSDQAAVLTAPKDTLSGPTPQVVPTHPSSPSPINIAAIPEPARRLSTDSPSSQAHTPPRNIGLDANVSSSSGFIRVDESESSTE
jgi:hypothetical protein